MKWRVRWMVRGVEYGTEWLDDYAAAENIVDDLRGDDGVDEIFIVKKEIEERIRP